MLAAILLAVLVCIYTMQSLFCKIFTQKYGGDTEASGSVFAVLYGGFVGLATLIISLFDFRPAPLTWVYGLLTALMLFIYNVSMVNSSRQGSYAFLTLCMLSGGIILPCIASVWILDKPLTTLAIVGILVMLAAFVVLNIQNIKLKGSPFSYYIWCALLFISNGLFGTMTTLQANQVGSVDRSEMVVITYIGSFIIALVQLLLARREKVRSDFARIGKKAWLAGLCSFTCATIAINLALFVLTLMNPAIYAAAENGAILVLSAICSAVVFKEKFTKMQIFGMSLAVFSIVLLSL